MPITVSLLVDNVPRISIKQWIIKGVLVERLSRVKKFARAELPRNFIALGRFYYLVNCCCSLKVP